MNIAMAAILADNDLTKPLLLVLGALLLVIFIPRALRRKKTAAGSRPERAPGPAPARAREQVEDMIVKLDDIGRELYAKLDNKIRILNHLIEDADDRIRKLQGLGPAAAPPPEQKKQAGPEPDKPAREKPAAPGPEKGKYTTVYELADAGQNVISIARQTGLQPGEIELLLELRKTRNNKDRDK
jgi:hypothetical protein